MATIKLKSWRGQLAISEAAGATTKSLVLGQSIDYGGAGSVSVTAIEYDTETGLCWYTLKPRDPGIASIRLFQAGDGVGIPVDEPVEPTKGKK